jgi:hypothetical protein
MLPILNHIIYTLIIIIIGAYILYDTITDINTKNTIYLGIVGGSLLLALLGGIFLSGIFNGGGFIVYIPCILFILLTLYLFFVNNNISGMFIKVFILISIILVGVIVGKLFNISSETDVIHIINMLKSHYSYLAVIFAMILSYMIYIYLKTGNQDPDYKCNLKVLTTSSIVAFIICAFNLIIYNSYTNMEHNIQIKY